MQGKPFDQFFLLLYQMFSKERVEKSKLTYQIKVKTALLNLKSTAVKLSPNQKIKDGQRSCQTCLLDLGQP